MKFVRIFKIRDFCEVLNYVKCILVLLATYRLHFDLQLRRIAPRTQTDLQPIFILVKLFCTSVRKLSHKVLTCRLTQK